MSELVLSGAMLEIAESGRITEADVLTLRREMYGDDKISRREAEAMLALDLNVRRKCPQWGDYFSEALVNFIVYQEDPDGHISQDNADWLIRCISRGGLVDSSERMEMLVKALERAQSSPKSLVQFALMQVSHAVLNNQGPLADNRPDEHHVICKADVEMIRRLIFAFGGEGGMAVTRGEAEFLFDLNDKTVEVDNHPSWSDLFVKAVGNHVLATIGNAVPVRTVALAKDQWMEGDSLFDTLVNSLRSVYRTAVDPQAALESTMAATNSALDEGQRQAGVLTGDEVAWISARIGKDGYLHENERALLQFLAEEESKLPAPLNELLRKVA